MNVGFVGWRGMVGSVLMQRMKEEGEFQFPFERTFFSTSNAGGKGPPMAEGQPLRNAYNVSLLEKCDIIVACQGSEWTSQLYPQLRKSGWKGIWLDTASFLRMEEDSIIVLDPLNRKAIEAGLYEGIRTFVGGNCTVSLMLMACHGLFGHGLLRKNLVEWISSMTYQAASGAGSEYMRELIEQIAFVGIASGLAQDSAQTALELDKRITSFLKSSSFLCQNFRVPLVCNLIPWIGKAVENGQTREEWKGFAEANKILGFEEPIPIDGICVRVGAMRHHSQALLIKLRENLPLEEIERIISEANEWIRIVPNEEEATIHQLTPLNVWGPLTIAVGRLRKARMGEKYLQLFTVGDQLIWGAAEPIRRTLRILLER